VVPGGLVRQGHGLTTHWSRHREASAALPLPGAAHRGRSVLDNTRGRKHAITMSEVKA
jgi:hypothetical protein